MKSRFSSLKATAKINPLNHRVVIMMFAVTLATTTVCRAQINTTRTPPVKESAEIENFGINKQIIITDKELTTISKVIEKDLALKRLPATTSSDNDEIRTLYRTDRETATDKIAGSFQLKIYHGFDFPNKRVIKYGNQPDLVDVKFYRQTRREGIFAYLRAAKIREFDSPPAGLSAAQVDEWKDYLNSPKTGGYYVVRSRDGRHYLLYLKKFENQGKGAGYWQLNFEWKEISI